MAYGQRVAWTYTTDDGRQFRVSINQQLTTNVTGGTPPVPYIGGSAAAATLPPKPSGLKMRRITVRNTALGISKTVPVMELSAPILTSLGTALTLDHAGTTAAFTYYGGLLNELDGRRVQK